MSESDPWASLWHQYRVGRIDRRALLQGLIALGGLALSPGLAAAQTPPAAGGAGGPKGGTVMVRWLTAS